MLWEAVGEERSKTVLKRRGRWASDVALIYQRVLVRTLLDASAALGDVDAGRELEAMVQGWNQPAV